MISFYPGPSQLDPNVAPAMAAAAESGLLSMNHRSRQFIKVCKDTVESFKQKLEIPPDYQVAFVSSATECWEIIAQSLTASSGLHIYNGAFGEKWFRYAQRLRPASVGHSFDINSHLNLAHVPQIDSPEMVCITQSETSNGTMVSDTTLQEVRSTIPSALIAIDAVSSMGGIATDWQLGDVWFASVQKCLGLPAGLAVMVLSPAAIKRANEIEEWDHYNSLSFIIEKMKDHQTTHTPNVLGIWVLGEVMRERAKISAIAPILVERAKKIRTFLINSDTFQPLIEDGTLDSPTVIAVKPARKVDVAALRANAETAGFLLGKGYGTWGESTFRIANFPAHTDAQIEQLLEFLGRH